MFVKKKIAAATRERLRSNYLGAGRLAYGADTRRTILTNAVVSGIANAAIYCYYSTASVKGILQPAYRQWKIIPF
jgi:hypothetical protein